MDENIPSKRRAVGGPEDGQLIDTPEGTLLWSIKREDGSLSWYEVDRSDEGIARYFGAAPPPSPADPEQQREAEAAGEETERSQDSAT